MTSSVDAMPSTRIRTPDRADEALLSATDLVLLDIKSADEDR